MPLVISDLCLFDSPYSMFVFSARFSKGLTSPDSVSRHCSFSATRIFHTVSQSVVEYSEHRTNTLETAASVEMWHSTVWVDIPLLAIWYPNTGSAVLHYNGVTDNLISPPSRTYIHIVRGNSCMKQKCEEIAHDNYGLLTSADVSIVVEFDVSLQSCFKM